MILQGPQAHLTSVTRELILVEAHTLGHLAKSYPDHTIHHEPMSVWLEPKQKQLEGPSGSNDEEATTNTGDNDETGGRIYPLSWENAPKSDGCMVEFDRQMEICDRYMVHFGLHTPQTFLRAQREATGADMSTSGGKKGTPVRRAVQKSGGGEGGRRSKRKAADDDNEGRSHM